MSQRIDVEIFIIGNEILIGDIQDTNTSWMCREINSLGGHVTRVTVLRDEIGTIAAELRSALERGPRVIITSGGLGPTADDLTLAAIAQGSGLELKLHEQARQMVKERYDEFARQGILSQGGLNAPREKMAWLPAGAIPLHNPVGTAPAVLLRIGRTAIISLPGVPSELKGIFASSLQQFLLQTFSGGTSAMRTISVKCNDESLLEPVLSRVAKEHPAVYLKSLATTIGVMDELDIILSAAGSDLSSLRARLDAALHDLLQGLAALGFICRIKDDVNPTNGS